MSHEVLVVTAADEALLTGHRERLAALGIGRVLPVLDARRGNLGGTLEAWAAIRDRVGPHERIAILHDGGQATRTRSLTGGTGGSRGALQLGARHGGRDVDLLGLVALAARAWANDPMYVDVFWGSQLVLPDRLEPPGGLLCKLARPTDPADVTDADVRDLGWFRTQDGVARGFAPRGELPTPDAVREFACRQPNDAPESVGPTRTQGAASGRRQASSGLWNRRTNLGNRGSFVEWAGQDGLAADLGSASFHRELLDALLAWHLADPRPRDLDPDLTGPWMRALTGAARDTDVDRAVARLLAEQPALAAPDAVRVRAFSGEWVRMRHPAEIRDALTVRVPRSARLRGLFGVEHPVERSRLGRVWVDGPELSWADVHAGTEIGGVRLQDAVVRDSTLHAGSALSTAWITRCDGRLEAHGAVALDVRHSGRLPSGVAVGWQTPSDDAVRALASGPPASDLPRLAGLITAGRLAFAPHGGPLELHVPPDGCAVVRVPAERWPLDARREGALGIACWTRHFGDPGHAGREALVPHHMLEVGVVPEGRDALVAAVARWSPADDPLRVRLGVLLEALEACGDGPIDDLDALRAAWRLGLEHHRWDLEACWASIGPRVPSERLDAWVDAGHAMRLGPATLPVPERPAPRGDLAAVLASLGPGDALGIAGPAAAGKSTLADALARRFADRGVPVARIEGDHLTWPGPTFRYVQEPGVRRELVEGPGLYDDRALGSAVRQARADGKLVIVDGVFVGLDPSVRAGLSALVVLAPDPRVAWERKDLRDGAPGSGRDIDRPSDFARKLFREHADTLGRLASIADVVACGSIDP